VDLPTLFAPLQQLGAGDLRPLVEGWVLATPVEPSLRLRWTTREEGGVLQLILDISVRGGGAPDDEPRSCVVDVAWTVGKVGRVAAVRLLRGQARLQIPVEGPVKAVRADPRGLFPGRVQTDEDPSLD
jgi:hypothetical protein